MKFTPRTSVPSESDYHYTSDNIYEQSNYGMFPEGNCPAYAWGRLYEITETKYPQLHGNAEQWWTAADNTPLTKGQIPKLGAIAVWKQGDPTTGTDGAGHVAVVEAIYDDGSWLASMSGYKHYVFKTTVIGPDNAYGAGDMDFLGFIYCGIEFDEEVNSMDANDARKLVVCDYVQYLGRMPSQSDIDTDTEMIVSTGMTTEEYDNSFLVSEEYHNMSGSLSAQDFVTRCYRAFLGRFPESAGALMNHVNQILNGSKRYRDVAWDIFDSEEAHNFRS